MSQLISCKTCKGDVSNNAKNCPHCGEPVASGFLGQPGTFMGAVNKGCFLIIVGFVVVLLMGGVLGSCKR